MIDRTPIKVKYEVLKPAMSERMRRLWAAAEADSLGWGGITAVSEASGLSRSTIRRGLEELRTLEETSKDSGQKQTRVRRVGGGRKRLIDTQKGLSHALDALIDPMTRGDPESPLRWTSKSTTKIAAALREQGFSISADTVGVLLRKMGFSLQSTRKRLEGASHPDRDAQFQYIYEKTLEFHRRGQPVISVDTKKKELVGEFSNGGREWQPKGIPEPVNVHDFPSQALGKAIPYGVYDVFANEGWVSVGMDHDTAEFSTESIKHWWSEMGSLVYPDAKELLITADGGGSNSPRTRLWLFCLQQLADETGLKITACHFPPGTSKWNKIEHRLFAHITKNWRGRPLESFEVVVNLIANTTTSTGLHVRASLDTSVYPTGKKVEVAEFEAIALQRAEFHGNWNYSIAPRSQG